MAIEIYIKLTGELKKHEWDSIDLFKRRADKLAQSEYSSGKYPISGKINDSDEKGLEFTCEIPPDHIIVEHLTAFRHFCFKSEKSYFPTILKLIARHGDSSESKKALSSLRRNWENALFRDALRISINNQNITASSLLDLWFNGEYFHSVLEKIRKLELMQDAFTKDFFKFMLLDVVTTGTNQIVKMGDALAHIERDDEIT